MWVMCVCIAKVGLDDFDNRRHEKIMILYSIKDINEHKKK